MIELGASELTMYGRTTRPFVSRPNSPFSQQRVPQVGILRDRRVHRDSPPGHRRHGLVPSLAEELNADIGQRSGHCASRINFDGKDSSVRLAVEKVDVKWTSIPEGCDYSADRLACPVNLLRAVRRHRSEALGCPDVSLARVQDVASDTRRGDFAIAAEHPVVTDGHNVLFGSEVLLDQEVLVVACWKEAGDIVPE